MHSRAARVTLVALLLAVGIGAALLTWTLATRAAQLDNDHRFVVTQLEHIDAIAADLATAQAAYVAPGQPNAPWFERFATLTEDLASAFVAIRPKTRSAETTGRLQAANAQLAQLLASDTMARDALRLDEELRAADIVFGEGRQAITALRATVTQLRTSEDVVFGAQRAALVQQMAATVGGVAAVWIAGLLLLLRVRAPLTTAVVPAPEPSRPAATAAPASAVDLQAAAELCTAISRVTSAKVLPDLLTQAATLLDATGVIVWMGAGEELFAAMSYGYDQRVISRLGPIGRTADNATAAAWRTGELRTVPGDAVSNGAIVAPMFGPNSCLGVVAAEVRHGREGDAATRAVTTMIAAQLSTVVPEWPAASSAPRAAEA